MLRFFNGPLFTLSDFPKRGGSTSRKHGNLIGSPRTTLEATKTLVSAVYVSRCAWITHGVLVIACLDSRVFFPCGFCSGWSSRRHTLVFPYINKYKIKQVPVVFISMIPSWKSFLK